MVTIYGVGRIEVTSVGCPTLLRKVLAAVVVALSVEKVGFNVTVGSVREQLVEVGAERRQHDVLHQR